MTKNPYFVNLTPELIEKAQKRLDFIASQGSRVNGVDETIDATIKPDWYDEERFKRSQKLVQKYYAAYEFWHQIEPIFCKQKFF